jgi:hypothetical protein
MKKQILTATTAILVSAAAAQASPNVAFILSNQGADNAMVGDDLSIFNPNPRVALAGGLATAFKIGSGGNIVSNAWAVDLAFPESTAKCTFHTQSVYSSFYGHYQITAWAPGVTNYLPAGGARCRSATCTQAFSFRQASSGDYDSSMTVKFQDVPCPPALRQEGTNDDKSVGDDQ